MLTKEASFEGDTRHKDTSCLNITTALQKKDPATFQQRSFTQIMTTKTLISCIFSQLVSRDLQLPLTASP